ncbi:MAG: TIGR03862 family flavoprotein [Hasllibacter sp.]
MTAELASNRSASTDALVIGGGPAGLAAAEALLRRGRDVVLAERMPTVGRKFLMAGKSGLNLTKREAPRAFAAAYRGAELAPALSAFGPPEVEALARGLGQPVTVGSTGRVFPEAWKASPMLRAWRARLEGAGLAIRTRWHWTGRGFDFRTPDGPRTLAPRVAVLALGGASWRRLGSDGAWAPWLSDRGVATVPFAPSNAGLRVDWSPVMAPHFGRPLKDIRLTAGGLSSRGEIALSAAGLEGGGLYEVFPAVRDGAPLVIDLAPGRSAEWLSGRLSGKASTANLLRRAGLPPVKAALLREWAGPLPRGAALAGIVKALGVRHAGPRPLDEAISTTGGVALAALDEGLMLRDWPGVFAAGEMLDWDAPTGGYLLTACLSTGDWAGRHAAAWDGPAP